jgi:hypothetical protein
MLLLVIGGSARHALSRITQVAPAPEVTAMGPDGVQSSWVMQENQRMGTDAWRITGTPPGVIDGFADRTYAAAGDTVSLAVSTDAPQFRVEAYRMGYYRGLGGRLVWQSDSVPGLAQPAPVVEPVTYTVEARWSPSLPVTIDRGWPPGDYLLKLVASTGAQSYVPLTVRDDRSHSAFVVQNSVTTWQAYNLWGGHSLYQGINPGRPDDFEHRSRVVSFDRPYNFGGGAADFLGNELPLVSLVESLGLDVTYWTDVDLDRRPDLLKNHRALLSLGHDEYWSTGMRRGAEDGRDSGVNIAFFGANAVFRHIRFTSSPLGDYRREVGYKRASEDPVWVYGRDRSEVTVDWRDPPLSEPESSLVGDYYECNPVKADMVVADSSNWVFSGTELALGDRLPDLVGPEYDRYDPYAPKAPGPVQVLAHSPVVCHGRSSYSDMTYYSAPSGAGVFATGTNWWVSRLSAPCPPEDCPHDDNVVRITENVLEAFGSGPAGQMHPSFDNYYAVSRLVPRATSSSTGPSGTRRPPATSLRYPSTPLSEPVADTEVGEEAAPPTRRRSMDSVPRLTTVPFATRPPPTTAGRSRRCGGMACVSLPVGPAAGG